MAFISGIQVPLEPNSVTFGLSRIMGSIDQVAVVGFQIIKIGRPALFEAGHSKRLFTESQTSMVLSSGAA